MIGGYEDKDDHPLQSSLCDTPFILRNLILHISHFPSPNMCSEWEIAAVNDELECTLGASH